MKCKNCNSEVNQHYCPNCGLQVEVKRIDGAYVFQEIGQVLNFEKGILYTVKELLVRPGENVRKFISEDRSRLIKPILFIIVTSLIYSLVNNFFHIEDLYINYGDMGESTVSSILQWSQNNYGYGNIIMGIFIAFTIRLFFRKYDYNFYEILILLCFVMGTGMLIFAGFALFQGLTKIESMGIASIVGVIYISWAIGQFFSKGKPINYLKAFASYILGAFLTMVIAVGIGLLIDALIK